ncbi:hypothetical protein Tco_1311392 [Tanacetum coccineum]
MVTIGGRLSKDCKDQLKTLLKGSMEVFAWEPADMTGVPQKIIEHAYQCKNSSIHKQMVAEKTSELERCLSELQDILIALEAAESRNAELTHADIFSNSLQEALSQKDMILQKCAQIMVILINTPYYFKF